MSAHTDAAATSGPHLRERDVILGIIADAGGTLTYKQLRQLLGRRPDPAAMNKLVLAQHITGWYDTPSTITDAGRRALARAHNSAARFTPAADAKSVGPTEPNHDSEPASYPSLTVAGAQAFLYVDADASLRLSLHLDTGQIPDWLIADPEQATVPLRITVNGDPVFDDTGTTNIATPPPVRFDADACRAWLSSEAGETAAVECGIDSDYRLDWDYSNAWTIRALVDWLHDHNLPEVWRTSRDVERVHVQLLRGDDSMILVADMVDGVRLASVPAEYHDYDPGDKQVVGAAAATAALGVITTEVNELVTRYRAARLTAGRGNRS